MDYVNPDDNDVKKIHAEVNQIENQKVIIIGFCFTLFIGVCAIIFKEQTAQQYNNSILIVNAYLIIQIAILWYLSILNKTIRCFTTYLRISKKSNWEFDWKEYRQYFYPLTYSKAQNSIVSVAGIIIMITQIGNWVIEISTHDINMTTMLFPVLSLLFICYSFLLIFSKKRNNSIEEKYYKNWSAIKSNDKKEIEKCKKDDKRIEGIINRLF